MIAPMTSGAREAGAERPIRAAAPGHDRESLRRAYLELLKLALCDLVGVGTTSVQGKPGGGLEPRELTGDRRRERARGQDWPLHGLTMTGLARLDDLQGCVESILEGGVEGDLIEAGSWRGGSSMLMRATLDTLAANERTVYVADSFAGFPTAEQSPPGEYPETLGPYLSAFEVLTAPLEEVAESFERLGLGRGVEFVPGFFEQTLPPLSGHRWSLIRLDADTYDATMLALRSLYPGLSPGGYAIIDDYGALEECRVAVQRFRSEQGIEEPLVQVDEACVRWRRAQARPPTGT